MEKEIIRKKILEEIENTEKLIDRYTEGSKPIAPDNAYGRLSRMGAIVDQSMIKTSLSKAKIRLGKLQEVMTKIDTPSFGICLRCCNPIPLARLLMVPESQVCVKCAK
ncbi:TraR/DksA C4-type zinc finger protein [bacterium]|nr:TraR/DksA C4-type zinc finger protein [bacterium]